MASKKSNQYDEQVSCSKKELLDAYKHALAERAYYNSQEDVEWRAWDYIVTELELLYGEEFLKKSLEENLVVDTQELNPFQVGDEVMFADDGTDNDVHVVEKIDGMNIVIDDGKSYPSEMFVLFERKKN